MATLSHSKSSRSTKDSGETTKDGDETKSSTELHSMSDSFSSSTSSSNTISGSLGGTGLDFKFKIDKKSVVSHSKLGGGEFYNGSLIEGVKKALITQFISLYEYQGFDPFMCRMKVEAQERNKKLFIDEITELTVLILSRGTKFDKAFKNSRAEAIARGKDLIQKYGYKRKPKSSDDASLSRHVHTFPDVCARVLANDKVRVIGEVPARLPRNYCFPGAAALFTKAMREGDSWGHYIEWSKSFSRVIKSNQSDEVISRYAEISYQSKIFDNDMRIAIVQGLNGVTE